MIDLSPASRRIIALGLLFLVVVTLVNLVVLPLAGAVGSALDQLADARFRADRLAAIDARPQSRLGPPVAPELVIHAPSHAAAAEVLLATLRAAAAAKSVTLDAPTAGPPDPVNPAIVAVRFAATAAEADLEALIADLEQGPPAVRLGAFTLTAPDSPKGQPRLDAQLLAVWAP